MASITSNSQILINNDSSTNKAPTTNERQLRRINHPPNLRIVPPLNFCPVENQLYRSGQPSIINQSFLNQLNLKTIIWLSSEEPTDEFLEYCNDSSINIEYLGMINEFNSEPATATTTDKQSQSQSQSQSEEQKSQSQSQSQENQHHQFEQSDNNLLQDPSHLISSTIAKINNNNPWDSLNENTIKHALDLIVDKTNYPILICCGMGRHRTGTVIGCLRRLQHWNLNSVSEEYRRFTGSRGGRILVELLIESFNIDLVSINWELAPDWLK